MLEHILMLNTALLGFFTALLLFFSLEVNFCKELQNSVLLVCLN